MINVKRGDIFYADIGFGIASEQGGTRPFLIIQNDIGNKYSPTIIVACITSQPKTPLPTHVDLQGSGGLWYGSKACLEQIKTISKERLRDKQGRVSDELMAKVDEALRVSLGIVQ